MHANSFKKLRGFTLVELLIVITIIGVLSVAFIPQLTGGREKARDARRQRDLNKIAEALHSWSSDNGGLYPGPLYNPGIPEHICVSEDEAALREIGKYLSKMPSGPKKGFHWQSADSECSDDGYEYFAVEGGKGFVLFAEMEVTTNTGVNFYESATFDPDLSQDVSTILNDHASCAEGDCATNGAIFVIYR